MHQKTAIIIAGPTAIGKTDIAIQLARQYQTSIISADSRQCYRELNIGVAKPTDAELALVPHHFINSHSIHETVNAAIFESYALAKAADIFTHNEVLIVVGGTGLYIKSFCEGIDAVPEIDPAIRATINAGYQANGLPWLQQKLKELDPIYFETSEQLNPHRLMRALEVKMGTGHSLAHFLKGAVVKRDFNIIKIGLELPRNLLYERINKRVDSMIGEGLEEEARNLFPYVQLNALQTVGYREWFQHFSGSLGYEAAIEAIKMNTRRYAKRQLTWFKKDKEIRWCPPEFAAVTAQIKNAGM